jgi:hypothetical protein
MSIWAGLITTHRAINYGAVLQAYALRQKIEEYTGYCEVIDLVLENKVTGRSLDYTFRTFKDIVRSLLLFLFSNKIKNKIRKIDEFVDKNMVLSKRKFFSYNDLCQNISKEYDVLICGSDQIWNLNLFKEPSFFLRFEEILPNIKYISYAPSIAEDITESQGSLLRENIKHFSAISVREQRDAEKLQGLTDKKVKSVIDPVFLLPTNEWNKIIQPIDEITEPYILLYAIAANDEYKKIVKRIKKQYQYDVICINSHFYNKYKADKLLTDISPGNFIWLIKNAYMVCTSSFHALAFSIIFNKEFIVVPDIKRASRHISILEALGIENHLFFSADQFDIKNSSALDFEQINNKLEILRQNSLNFLSDSLGI